MLSATGFQLLAAAYRRFALQQPGGERFVGLLASAVDSCGLCDPTMERAITRAHNTNHMVDVELAKELFHSRLRLLDRAGMIPEGVNIATMFDGADIARPGSH